MVPLATLHHFVHPQWFEDAGGFEREANIDFFLQWTELAYRRGDSCPSSSSLAAKNSLFCSLRRSLRFTFSSPAQ